MLPLARRRILQRWQFLEKPQWRQSLDIVRFASHKPLELPSLDKKWQARWAEAAPAALKPSLESVPLPRGIAPKAYILPMFPYPSGNLHMGHFRVYTISDVLARFNRLQGRNVLHPMGWDAFGLPAENAAIEKGIDPATWTDSNIANMKDQLKSMNTRFDWDREIKTSDPEFFKHTQRLFLKLYKKGLAYQAEAMVNYDPIDRTVLANEQVDSNGFSWRSGAKVEKQYRRQWFVRITAYQDALSDDLDKLAENNRWPARIISMQQNWLGKSEGAKITFQISTEDYDILNDANVKVFTTRPDTLHGVQYLALSISHPLVQKLVPLLPQLQAFVDSAPLLPADSKAGFLLPGLSARNPLSALRNVGEYTPDIPIYVAPYVLDYGEKAIMGVPGHDNRDFLFWKAHHGDAPVRRVVEREAAAQDEQPEEPCNPNVGQVFEEPGVLSATCGDYSKLPSEEAAQYLIRELDEAAENTSQWRLRDWLISRQRYWGTPIPIIHCSKCGPQPVPRHSLPVMLPKMKRDGQSGIVAENDDDWLQTKCPVCKGQATRETDTMDTFVDSSWYYMRFCDPKRGKMLVASAAADEYLPVDLYIGGIEHAILHLLYARFISKFIAEDGFWPSGRGEPHRGEPFHRVISQGMVHGKTFTEPQTGRFLKPEELDLSDVNNPKIASTGVSPCVSWEKMSKSKYNGVDPVDCISKYGADVIRAHMLFQAPVSQVLEWDEERIVGIERWFTRVWRYLHYPQEAAAFEMSYVSKYRHILGLKYKIRTGPNDWDAIDAAFKNKMKHEAGKFKEHEFKAWIQVQKTIVSVTDSLSKTFALNTVISDLMALSNVLIAPRRLLLSWPMAYQSWSAFFRMLAPIAPAFAEECWERTHALCKSVGTRKTSIFDEKWPEEDGSLAELQNRSQTCAVQEDGKLRFTVEIERPPEDLNQTSDLPGLREWALEQIQGTEQGGKFLEGKTFERIVVVRNGRTVNFVSSKGPKEETYTQG